MTTMTTMTTDARELVWHAASRRFGRLVCATSPHADGSPRLVIEWNDGTEGKVPEVELSRPDTTTTRSTIQTATARQIVTAS
jgi:hypothetical protein